MAAGAAAATALRGAGLALLGLAALAGVILSAAVLYATSPAGRPVVAGAVIRLVDDAVAGRLELGGVTVLSQGGVEIRELRVFDPEERLVLAVDRARVFADVTRLRAGELGLVAELDGPAVLLDEDPDGNLTIARAFASARPKPEEPEGDDGGGLAFRLSRVVVRNGSVWWLDAEGETRLEASRLDLDARGLWSSRNAFAELRLRGELAAPVEGPFALDAALSRDGDALNVPLLSARLGETAVELAGHADLGALTGRAAVRRFAVDRADARALAPAAGAGADLEGAAYAEADGRVATAAVTLSPRAGEAGRAELAVAVTLDGARALGFDVALDRVDPARLHGAAPAGEVTLTARGAAEGTDLETLRGRAEVALAPSRLRTGRLGPVALAVRAGGGLVRLERLDLRAPGIAVTGQGTWRARGAVAGTAAVDAADLGAALANLGALLGEALPPASGAVSVKATLSGTAARPALAGRVESAALRAFDVAARGVGLDVEVAGPPAAATGRASGQVGALAVGGAELARGLTLEAEVAGEEVRLDASGLVPSLGDERVAVEARGTFGPRRETFVLSALGLAYPGTRWALTDPATVSLAGPSVDRLALASGPQRLAVSGGFGRRGALDARVEASSLELARLPRGLLPPGIAGTVSLDARASGTTARPDLVADVSLAGGGWRNLSGLDARAELRLDGAGRRLALTLGLERARGGSAELEAELPWPVLEAPARASGPRQARATGALRVRLRAERLPLEDLVAVAEVEPPAPVEGLLSADVLVEGTARAPRLQATLGLADGAYDDFFPIAARVSLADQGEGLLFGAGLDLDGRPALTAEARWPLAIADLLDAPGDAADVVARAPLRALLKVPGFDLAAVEGTLGVPDGVAGRLEGGAELEGSLAAPRGAVRLLLSGGAVAGYRDVAGGLSLALAADHVSAEGRVAIGAAELLALSGSLRGAPEALLEPAALRRAPLALELTVPEGPLARVGGDAFPLAGTLRGAATARGTLSAPSVEASLSGTGVEVDGRPLGELSATARYAAGRTDVQVELVGAREGRARATFGLDAPLGLGAETGPLGERPAELRLVAERLDLGVLPALAFGLVRSASGRIDADVVARGPLARPSPRGTVTVSDGRFAVTEYGDWTDVRLDVEVTDDAVELRRAEARRGGGSVSLSGALRGIRSGRARLEGHARADSLTVIRAGGVLATFDLEAKATGTYRDDRLEAEVRVPRAMVRLPDKLPRDLQALETRSDITIGRPKQRRRPPGAAAVSAAAAARPLTVVVRVLAPDQLFVRSENPRVELELAADVTFEYVGGESFAEGSIDVKRGAVEPMGGRSFAIERGRLQFTGGPPSAALVDVEARYVNPAAEVTVVITGPAADPEFRLSSQPPMEEAQIAMLIATGRSDMKAGASGAGAITGQEAGLAALSALATQVFKGLVSDKLPLDTVALDSSTLRAGKYVTDKIYVGYTRRFDADLDADDNTDEVRVEYQISSRWTFESRYGNAQSGGASLIWSKDY